MSKIDKLIKELCPEGVRMVKLIDALRQPITDGPHETPNLIDIGIPFISVESIQNGKIDVTKCRGYISKEYSDYCRKKYKPEIGDVYMVKSASIGRVAMVLDDCNFDIWSPLAAMKPEFSKLHPRFLYYILQSDKIQKEVKLKSSTGSQPNLSMRKLELFTIPLPPLSIQQEIVKILDTFTTLIDKMKQEVEKRKKQMEYYREQLLTFKEGECEWKTLGEVGAFYNGVTGKNKNDFVDGNAKFISYMNVFTNPSLKTDVLDRIKISDGEKQNTIEYGDVLFTTSSETPEECGMSSVLTERTEEKLYLNSFCFGFRFNSLKDINPSFYKHLFRSTHQRAQIVKTANGVTRFNVSKKLFASIEIPLPPLQIQQEIVSTLDKFESYITKLEKMIELRQKQYEYYREQLLTFE